MKIRIEKELFQWEKDRKVFVDLKESDPIVTILEFYNKKSKLGEAELLEGSFGLIPNNLLKTADPIIILACTGTIGNTQPVKRKEFRVIPRPCPENYSDDADSPILPDTPENDKLVFDGGEEN